MKKMATRNQRIDNVTVAYTDIFVDDSVDGLIGEGGFGKVYRAKFRDSIVAFKEPLEKTSIPKPKKRIVQKEAEKLVASTHHPFIVTLFGVVLDQRPGLILEYMHFGSCTDFIDEYDIGVPLRLKFLRDILSAMAWLHSNDPPIRHLDLKAENVLVNNYFDAKISDFGLSQWKTATTVNLANKQRHGTITHVPPEVFRDITKKGSVEEDVYAFGITAWEIFTGRKPYEGCSQEMIQTAVLKHQRPDINLVVQQCPKTVTDMIKVSWDGSPMHRPKFSELETQFTPVYNAAYHQLDVSIQYVRQGILYKDGADSEKYQCTMHFDNEQHVASKQNTPTRNTINDHVNGERISDVSERHQELESTPRQDGLETNIERDLSNLTIMSPDGDGQRFIESNDRQVTENSNENNDNPGLSGFVSLAGKKYIPGHQLGHPQGVVVHPTSAEPSMSGVYGSVGREDESARKQVGAEQLNAYVTHVRDIDPDIAKTLLSNPDAMSSLQRSLTSPTDVQPRDHLLQTEDRPMQMEDRPQHLTIHGGSPNQPIQSQPAGSGNTTGVVSADQQRSSIETKPQLDQNNMPGSAAGTQTPVTTGNQSGVPTISSSGASGPPPNLISPNLVQGTPMRQNMSGNRPQQQPGTFDYNQTPCVQLPIRGQRQPAIVGPTMPSQVNMQPLPNTQTSLNTQRQTYATSNSTSHHDNTTNRSATSAGTSGNRSQEQRYQQQTSSQPEEDRVDSGSGNGGQSNAASSQGPITIQHKHNDGAFTTIKFDGTVKYPPNMQIGNNMVMYVNNGRETKSSRSEKPKKRSPQCQKAELTTNNSIPEVETIDLVCVEIGADWKRLFRQLDLFEPEIDQLQYDHHASGLYEITYQGIRSWKQRNGSDATVRKLAIALWEIERYDIAKKLH